MTPVRQAFRDQAQACDALGSPLMARLMAGLADRLYAALMDEARLRSITDLTVIASRYAQSFFARHGWTLAPDLTAIPGKPDKDITTALTLSRMMRRVLT